MTGDFHYRKPDQILTFRRLQTTEAAIFTPICVHDFQLPVSTQDMRCQSREIIPQMPPRMAADGSGTDVASKPGVAV
ncbi:MAG: hypothetical protein ABF377_02280 [Akkermansiaceae bacterium]